MTVELEGLESADDPNYSQQNGRLRRAHKRQQHNLTTGTNLPATVTSTSDFKPKLRINLPNGGVITVFSYHGALVISDADRTTINSTPGFSANTKNYFGDGSVVHTNGDNFNIKAASGGANAPNTSQFRTYELTGPSTVQQIINVVTPGNARNNIWTQVATASGQPVNLDPTTGGNPSSATNGFITQVTNATSNGITNQMNNIRQNAPANANVNFTSVNVPVNQNLSAQQQNLISNQMATSLGVPVNVIPTNFANNSQVTGQATVNFNTVTQQVVNVPTVQRVTPVTGQ